MDTYFTYLGCDIFYVKKFSMSAKTLIFCLQPTDKKLQYLNDIGKLHSDFKFFVVRNAFYNFDLDSFGLFKKSNAAGTGIGTMIHAAAGVGQGKLDRPHGWRKDLSATIISMMPVPSRRHLGSLEKKRFVGSPLRMILLVTERSACTVSLERFNMMGEVLRG